MAEARKFQMHEKLLLDVIMKQAGSIEKAVLEAVMNLIEAGASSGHVSVQARQIVINDDGKGFCNKQEIEKFFETFGQPHEASEGKKWAQFRMGRGQMFAFGVNEWRTGTFKMVVDIKKKLGYDLDENLPDHKGCRIVIDLYEGLNPREINSISQEIERYVKFVDVPIEVNGVKVNTPAKNKKWDTVNEDGYFTLTDGYQFAVYNMGVFVANYPKSKFGCGGTVCSKERLEVNFARNDIIQSCPEWKKLKKEIERFSPKVKQKHTLDDQERENMIARLVAGELTFHDASKMPLLVDASGHPWSFRRVLSSSYKAFTVCAANDRKADKIIQSGQALCFDENIVKLFKVKPENLFSHAFKFEGAEYAQSFGGKGGPTFVPFTKLSASIKDGHIIIPKEKWTKGENKWVRVLEKASEKIAQNVGVKPRNIVVGECETALAWTDGVSYIAFQRDFLNSNKLLKNGCANLDSISEVLLTQLHEYCHTDDSTGKGHPPEFYKLFHDAAFGRAVTNNAWYHHRCIGTIIDDIMGWLTPKQLDILDRNAKGNAEPIEPDAPMPIAAMVAVAEPEVKTPKTPMVPKVVVSGSGRMAKDVTDPSEVAAIKAARAEGKTWTKIEEEFGLKPTKGMTAYAVVNRKGKA